MGVRIRFAQPGHHFSLMASCRSDDGARRAESALRGRHRGVFNVETSTASAVRSDPPDQQSAGPRDPGQQLVCGAGG